MAFPSAAQVEELITPTVSSYGLDVEEVRATRAGKKSVIAVAVDGDNRPDLDVIEKLSKELSAVLDESEEQGLYTYGASYSLEVSTPGVDHPLTKPRHWRRHRHRLVRFPERDETWRVGALDESESSVVLVRGKNVEIMELARAPKAVVEIEFASAPENELVLTRKDYAEVAPEEDRFDAAEKQEDNK